MHNLPPHTRATHADKIGRQMCINANCVSFPVRPPGCCFPYRFLNCAKVQSCAWAFGIIYHGVSINQQCWQCSTSYKPQQNCGSQPPLFDLRFSKKQSPKRMAKFLPLLRANDDVSMYYIYIWYTDSIYLCHLAISTAQEIGLAMNH